MKILVTGSKGFVGQNLVWNLKQIQNGNDRTRPNLKVSEIVGIDKESTVDELREACRDCDFVFNLAGVNRPNDDAEYMKGNFGFASKLLDCLKEFNNRCPVMLASSIQAELTGRFENSEYGKSKLAGEKLFFKHGKETGARVLVYRFPNIFGKWCKPKYNSVVATFCDAIANNNDFIVNDPCTMIKLVYIDDVVNELIDSLEGKEHKNGQFCYVTKEYQESLGYIADLLKKYSEVPFSRPIPDIPFDSFEKKLLSTYLSYLPERKISYLLDMNKDNRGIFTELIKTESAGQISVNIARPGITRGEHWHNSKWEIFIVVSGHGLIRERRLGIDPNTGEEYPILDYEVFGDKMEAIQMIPGYVHSIVNLSDTENLVTVMWANELFDESRPDTFYEKVK